MFPEALQCRVFQPKVIFFFCSSSPSVNLCFRFFVSLWGPFQGREEIKKFLSQNCEWGKWGKKKFYIELEAKKIFALAHRSSFGLEIREKFGETSHLRSLRCLLYLHIDFETEARSKKNGTLLRTLIVLTSWDSMISLRLFRLPPLTPPRELTPLA